MAEYKGIKGFKTQSYATDPVNTAIGGGTWASAPSVNTGRSAGGGAGSSQTAALFFGGTTGSASDLTESYNGSTWTEVGDLPAATNFAGGSGTQTAAAQVAGDTGSVSTQHNVWNGTSWAADTAINTARRGNNGLFGITTALIFTSGYPPTGATEKWNGSTWTEVADINTARWAFSTAGTVTAGIAYGGEVSPNKQTEYWDGTSWSAKTELNSPAGEIGGAGGTGGQTSAMRIGGGPSVAICEYWDGSTWTEIADLATARAQMPTTGNAVPTAMAISGGQPSSPYNTQVEEFSAPASFTKLNE